MPLGASHVVTPGMLHQDILSWSYPVSQRPQNTACVYTVDESSDVVCAVTYDFVDSADALNAFTNIQDCFLTFVFGSEEGRGGVVHTEVEVDLRRGVQIAFPCLSMSLFATYPKLPDDDETFQPALRIRASVGRGGHGCGCPTRTLPALNPDLGEYRRIPVLAYSAVLIAPAVTLGAVLTQYSAPGGLVISQATLVENTDAEVLIAPGALWFTVSGAPDNSSICFQLAC